MDVFDLRSRLVEDYGRYTRSFIKIADARIRDKVDGALDAGALWPQPLLQLNPTFLPGGTVDALVADGTLHPECAKIFRVEKSQKDPVGKQLLLYKHQTDAIRKVRYLCGTTAGGLRPSQVAVLAPGRCQSQWPKDFKLVRATRNFDAWRRNESVLVESRSRFKGLEADAVVIIEMPGGDDEHEAAHRYVARSRAKHLLTVIEVQ